MRFHQRDTDLPGEEVWSVYGQSMAFPVAYRWSRDGHAHESFEFGSLPGLDFEYLNLHISSAGDIGDVGSLVSLQLPLTLPQQELDSTKILLVHFEVLLELFTRESIEVGPSVERLVSCGAETFAVEG